MQRDDPKLREIWSQTNIAVIYRRAGSGESLLMRLPDDLPAPQLWVSKNPSRLVPYDERYKCWQPPRSRFNELIKRSIQQFGSVYVIQPFRTEEKCEPACWNALGADCECSCMGRNHGSGNPEGKWHVVAETFAVRWGDREYSCRLLTTVTESAVCAH